MEEAKKMKCYKRLIYKQFVQVSGLCGPQFLSYLPKRFTHLCRALYGDAILVYGFGTSNMAARDQQKHLHFTFSIKALPFHLKTSIRAHKHIFSYLRWLYCWKSRGETFFNETVSALFWCHAQWKLGSSNCCILEMKHAAGMETCARIYFFVFSST